MLDDDRYKKIVIGLAAGGFIAGSAYLLYRRHFGADTKPAESDEGFSDDVS